MDWLIFGTWISIKNSDKPRKKLSGFFSYNQENSKLGDVGGPAKLSIDSIIWNVHDLTI